jgi:hypothetical protein
MDETLRAAIAADQGDERRQRPDRRRLTWRTFVQGSLTPRRRGNRRSAEGHSLIDWHEPHLLFLAIMILLLSVTDAFLTLTLLARGATEANPLLALVLEHFPQYFAAVKMSLTGIGIVVLVALARARVFRVVRISLIIHWCMLGYLALILYEARLVSLSV